MISDDPALQMKRCPYCGTEYPHYAVQCPTDGHALTDPLVTVPAIQEPVNSSNEEPESNAPPLGKISTSDHEVSQTYPGYRWSARDAWKCLGMFLLIGFILGLLIHAIDKRYFPFRSWRRGPVGYVSRELLHFLIGLLTAAYFARTESFSAIAAGFGLTRKPSDRVWFGLAMAFIIRGVGYIILAHRWAKGVSHYDLTAFRHTFGGERYLFLVPLVVFAPFFEEIIYRGFLYKAFRNSYPVWASMALLVAWTTYSHWGQYSTSWVAALDLSALTIVQCYLREKSDSLWDCILCHFAFNASILFVGRVFRWT